MAGIELALWDIKAQALGVSVCELSGGPMRDKIRLYWSHCGTSRARNYEMLGTPPLRSYDDITALGKEVVAAGFTALKTNIVIPGDPAYGLLAGLRRRRLGGRTASVTAQTLNQIERLIGTFREAVGPDVGIALDLNYNFRTDGVQRICKLLEQFNMQWVEYDNWDPVALRQIKDSTSTPIASLREPGHDASSTGRSWSCTRWTSASSTCPGTAGFRASGSPTWRRRTRSTSRRTTTTATWRTRSRRSSAATLPNVRIMEIDIDDVSWKRS